MSAQPELTTYAPPFTAVFSYVLEETGPGRVRAVMRDGSLIVGGRRNTAFTGKMRNVRARMRDTFPNAVEASAPRAKHLQVVAKRKGKQSVPDERPIAIRFKAALPGMEPAFAPKRKEKPPYRLYGDPMDGVHPLFRPLLGVWQPIASHDYTEGE